MSSPTGGADVRIALPDLSALTVLVIEDDTDSRHLLYEVLQSCGATVLVAEDGRTGQRHVGTVKLDLIVTDLALPGLDGVEFLRWLREQPRNRGGNVPVVAVTAYHERYPPTNVAGWAAYFRKPLDPHDLVRTIAAILRRPGPELKIGGST